MDCMGCARTSGTIQEAIRWYAKRWIWRHMTTARRCTTSFLGLYRPFSSNTAQMSFTFRLRQISLAGKCGMIYLRITVEHSKSCHIATSLATEVESANGARNALLIWVLIIMKKMIIMEPWFMTHDYAFCWTVGQWRKHCESSDMRSYSE